MKMQRRQFRIGQLAKKLNLERFVIRFWEKEFGLKSHRSDGGQRFYTEQDLKTFTFIKELLYEKGFTIAGAKKILKGKSTDSSYISEHYNIIASKKTSFEDTNEKIPDKLSEKLKTFQKQLIKFKELL